MRKIFQLPNLDDFLNLDCITSEKVVIISIIGKSASESLGIKVKCIGKTFLTSESTTKTCVIEGSYDQENQIIYLHLHSVLDADNLINNYEVLLENCRNERNCSDFLAVNDEIKSIFARAMLLLVHISHIVIISHPGTTFDTNYIQFFKAVDGLSQKLFASISEALRTLNDLSVEWTSNGRFCVPRFIFYFERCPKAVRNLKKLEHTLEDRIYRILKKTRIINSFGSSLFAIPLNEEFVYISTETNGDKLGEMVKGLIKDCKPGMSMEVQPPFCSIPTHDRSFIRFIHGHIHQARTKGFHDTGIPGRHQLIHPVYFEVPTIKHWIESTKVLYEVIMRNTLISSLCTDTRFSEQRCLKVLPLAIALYQEGLPSHYAYSEHERRLLSAMYLFAAQARGSVFDYYANKLETDCTNTWENGRQQCEVASLTGNPCKLPKHGNEMEHKSGCIFKSICDCGRKIGIRDDPYNIKQANYGFYQQICKECICFKLERYKFPIFEPSTKDFKAATVTEKDDELSILTNQSDNHLTSESDKGLLRQPSTTEYLPGMLTLNSPSGLLPLYSSWSLVCLGPSSLYSHNLGLSESHHPGFLNSTNYLLPWDVTVFSQNKNWQINKFTNRGRRGRTVGGNNIPQFTVKVFIGVEYECVAGHRFMLAAPDKMLKATPGSIVKDTGHKIAESEMPLFFPCVCRTNKLAQLMRLHCVTPKAPVHCTLDPKIMAGIGSPIFISTTERPIKLSQSAYWVMRLPFVYMSEKEFYPQNLTGRLLQGVFGVVEVEQ